MLDKLAYLDIETFRFFQDPDIKALPESLKILDMPFAIGAIITQEETYKIDDATIMLNTLHELQDRGFTLVSFNGHNFDLPVIALTYAAECSFVANSALYSVRELLNNGSIDLFELIRDSTKDKAKRARWCGLDDLANGNLGSKKQMDGQKAAELLRLGDAESKKMAMQYCINDCVLLKGLTELAFTDGLILHENKEKYWYGDYIFTLDASCKPSVKKL